MTNDEKLTKYFNALTEIAEIKEGKGLPFYTIYAQQKLERCVVTAKIALGKSTDYSKQPKLDL